MSYSIYEPVYVILELKVSVKTCKHFERKIVNIVIVNFILPIIFNICFGCSKEPSELRNKTNNF